MVGLTTISSSPSTGQYRAYPDIKTIELYSPIPAPKAPSISLYCAEEGLTF
jgi:hypothetical protein